MMNEIEQTGNPATDWAMIFVGELARLGLRAVCITPGSRSTPLALAFAAHPQIELHLHLDERAAAYFALGIALATGSPVALLCTSGTATANFHPAVIEAYQSHLPLLLLTSDRPPELRQSGANQTIDQIKMYGDHVLWAVDVALPQTDPPLVATRNLRTLAARALATANGLVKGPVHLNFPFRKPLEPQKQLAATTDINSPPFTTISRGVMQPDTGQIDWLTAVLTGKERGLIVCGPRCPDGAFAEAVAALSRHLCYPIMADPLSGVRFGPQVAGTAVCGSYETFFNQPIPWPPPQVMLRFGAVPTSKWLNSYLHQHAPDLTIHIRENGQWADDGHVTRHLLQVNETAVCRQLIASLPHRTSSAWQQAIQAREVACRQQIAQELTNAEFDVPLVCDLLQSLPAGSHLFVGNSLPIRHVDQFVPPDRRRLHIYANRGASGIDGVTSTALGVASTTTEPVILLIGDISFYHDLTGLMAAQKTAHNLTIMLLNNGSGSIFHRLPIAAHEPAFTQLFLTPHNINFAAAAALYGLRYQQPANRAATQKAVRHALGQPGADLIEVRTDGAADHVQRLALLQAVQEQVS